MELIHVLQECHGDVAQDLHLPRKAVATSSLEVSKARLNGAWRNLG